MAKMPQPRPILSLDKCRELYSEAITEYVGKAKKAEDDSKDVDRHFQAMDKMIRGLAALADVDEWTADASGNGETFVDTIKEMDQRDAEESKETGARK